MHYASHVSMCLKNTIQSKHKYIQPFPVTVNYTKMLINITLSMISFK